MQKNKLYKYKNVSGLGVFEIIMAVAIMMIITPAVLKYSFKELFEVKYISIAKHLKKIEKSLLNYMSIEKQNWAVGSSGGISGNVKEKLVESYGLDTDIPKELTDGMQVKYTFEEATDAPPATPVVYAILDMSKLGFDEMAFKQTLLYAGDNVGYKEDAQAYSITGAWSDSMDDNMTNLSGDRIVVIRVDDTNLEDEYQSKIYLYRNDQGGAEGNQMGVDFDLDGYSIRNFGLIDANNVLASDGGDVSEIKFNKGTILGPTKIATSLILKGKLSFDIDVKIETKLLEILDLKQGTTAPFSKLKELLLPKSLLVSSTTSNRAKVIVDGVAKLSKLTVTNMQLASHPSGSGADTPLIIKPRALGEDAIGNPTNTTELNLDIPVSNIETLKTNVITVKNGGIRSANSGFIAYMGYETCKGCVMLQPTAKVYLVDIGDDGVVTGYGCGSSSGELAARDYQLDQMFNKFNDAIGKLNTKIVNKTF